MVELSSQEVTLWNHPANYASLAPDIVSNFLLGTDSLHHIKTTPIARWVLKVAGLFPIQALL